MPSTATVFLLLTISGLVLYGIILLNATELVLGKCENTLIFKLQLISYLMNKSKKKDRFLDVVVYIPGESKKVYAFGRLWNNKYVADIPK